MTILQELIGNQSLVVWIVLGTIGFLLTWRGANIVESTTSKISDHFGVSQAVQGGLIVAAATSFPELAIIIISVLVLGDFGVGAGALIGTAVFNIFRALILLAGNRLLVLCSCAFNRLIQFTTSAKTRLALTEDSDTTASVSQLAHRALQDTEHEGLVKTGSSAI